MSNSNVYDRRSMYDDLQLTFKSTMDHLDEIWTECGIDEKEIVNRTHKVVSSIKDILHNTVKNEDNLMRSIKFRIQILEAELNKICKELKEPYPTTVKNSSLILIEEFLYFHLNLLKQKKKERIETFQLLKEQENQLCGELHMTQIDVKSTHIPSEQDLIALKESILSLTNKKRQNDAYCEIKQQLIMALKEANLPLDISFVKEVIDLSNVEEAAIPSEGKLNQLKELVKKVQQIKENMVNEIRNLKEELNTLWDHLNVNSDIKEKFYEQHNEIRPATIIALKQEINHYKEMKQKNVINYINTLRSELITLWDKCFISQNEICQFEPFFSDNYTEELIHLHKAEIDQMNKFLKNSNHIFEKIIKRQELWNTMVLLEKKPLDPNYGGNHLQDERQKNKILMDLPKLEESIIASIKEYNNKNIKPFLLSGISFSEFMKEQWANYKELKENQLCKYQNFASRKRTLSYPLESIPSKASYMNSSSPH